MHKKHAAHGDTSINTNAWMMSYADMATTLLAMFIVLSTLGKDQTGISLYNGTGSFVHSLDSFGLPGFFPGSTKVIQFKTSGPHYQGQDAPGSGGNSENDGMPGNPNARIIDMEEEQLQHFLREMGRQFRVEKLPRTAGQATVDFYDPIHKSPPYLDPKPTEVLWQIISVLRRPNYRVSLIIWATTPSESAWTRAAGQAAFLVNEIAKVAELDSGARARLVPLGQPWRYPKVRRPIMSLVIAKTEA